MDKAKLGEKIRQLRRERGFTQESLCADAGFSKKVAREIESGTGNPTLETLEALASTMGVPFFELFSNQDGGRMPAEMLDAKGAKETHLQAVQSSRAQKDAEAANIKYLKPVVAEEVRKAVREEIQALKADDDLLVVLNRLSKADRDDLIAIANRRLSSSSDNAKTRARRK